MDSDHVYRTVGSVSRYIGQYRLCINQVSSTMGLIYWPTVGLIVVKYQLSVSLISHNMWINAVCQSRGWSSNRWNVDQYLGDTQSTFHRYSTITQPTVGRYIGRVSLLAKCFLKLWQEINRVSVDIFWGQNKFWVKIRGKVRNILGTSGNHFCINMS